MVSCASAEEWTQPTIFAGRNTDELMLASRRIEGGVWSTELSIPRAHCRGCIAAVERALAEVDGVISARLNLSTRRALVTWRAGERSPRLLEALANAGFEAHLSSAGEQDDADPERDRLFRATAVAGFAAMNIMLLSVSIWAGADGGTRDLFHLISAMIALPAVAYSGRIFFGSAWSALSAGRTNMDVPISIGIALTLALSIYETLDQGAYAYFDAAASLTFFLLIGRTLEHSMRRRTRSAVLGLARMMPRGANVVTGSAITYKKLEDILPGEQVMVKPGDRIPLDGEIVSGAADLDASMVTGEPAPVAIGPGERVVAGMLNLDGSLVLRVVRGAQDSFTADMIRLMEAAEHCRVGYRRIADRAARLYSPVVHSLAALALLGWLWTTGDFHRSLTVAISVLIITCPCALGLAVPMVQVTAARRLFERGIALKDGGALERLAETDHVAFDKTGTLTSGKITALPAPMSELALNVACALASCSQHPISRAIASLRTGGAAPELREVREHAGKGIEGSFGGDRFRLGRVQWAMSDDQPHVARSGTLGPVLTKNGVLIGGFAVSDSLREDATATVRALRLRGMSTEMLSGDTMESVAETASALGLSDFNSGLLPGGKIARMEELRSKGRKVLMVGDGLNDAPALSAAYVSMAPASAADIGRAAADLVFFGPSLLAVDEAVGVARRARNLIRQNIAMAIGYNALVIPVALAGLVTPLMAAVAMSLSSILVVANALRIARAPRAKGNAMYACAITGRAVAPA